jgi:hypothetical protein
MLENDWVIKAEVRIESIRKTAENELQVLSRYLNVTLLTDKEMTLDEVR